MTIKPLSNLSHVVACALAGLTLSAAADHKAAAVKTTKPLAPSEYEGGRGLLTLQGPTGLFINPTSGTLPANAFTAQYCFFLPNNSSSPVMGHGAMASYGVTDWLELGGIFTALDFNRGANPPRGDIFGGGPLIRLRLLKDEGAIPQLSVGGYFRMGDIETYNAFIALYKRVEIDPNGFFRSVGFHGGLRQSWIGQGGDASDAPVGYAGLEVQLPYRLYVVGEVSTTDRDSGGTATPYGFGLQWRAGGINISAAFTNPGNVREPSFYFGIGTQLRF